LRALGVSGGALALGGCASLGASETAQFYSSRIAANPTVLAATTRKPVSGGRAKPWYGPDRGTLSLARVRLTPPKTEGFSFASIGQGEWAIQQVEPMRGQLGELIATEARGTLMGNRGCLHDESQRIRRACACRRWIACVLEFRGRHRRVMAPGRYTELFFLDEATALAAGHRPCAECQHARYRLFRDVWAAANPGAVPSAPPSADEMDRVLHAERVGRGGEKHTYPGWPSELPTGAMVADECNRPFLVLGSVLVPWEPSGYGRAVPTPVGTEFRVLTPRSIVRALAAGYPVAVHPTATIAPDAEPDASADGRRHVGSWLFIAHRGGGRC
jgi:hypothetical protein